MKKSIRYTKKQARKFPLSADAVQKIADMQRDLDACHYSTEDEHNKLLEAAGSKEKLTQKLLDMENRKDVPKNHRSIYRTCLNWLYRDKK